MGLEYQTGNGDIADFADMLWKLANKMRGSVANEDVNGGGLI